MANNRKGLRWFREGYLEEETFLFFLPVAVVIEPRRSQILGKYSVIELHAQQGDDIMKPDDKGLDQARRPCEEYKAQGL